MAGRPIRIAIPDDVKLGGGDIDIAKPTEISIVVRSLDEADRLRLMLTSLTRQTADGEVVVVNDGSTDHTRDVLADFAGRLRLRAVHHDAPRGRSAAANAGAKAASGAILLFMDGDTLLAPDSVEHHLAIHRAEPDALVRGANHHLRCTRFLRDPATASPQPGQEERLARMSAAERERLRVTPDQVSERFGEIVARAAPGIYPGIGPARLYELERAAFETWPDCPMLWAAASAVNFSVRREAFLGVGGFDVRLDVNEHRELALRLVEAGGRMRFAAGASCYHLTHRSGWRDPLEHAGWESVFHARHPILAVRLLSVFWAGIASPSPVPPEARIADFAALAAAAEGRTGIDYDMVRRLIPGLPDLTAAPC